MVTYITRRILLMFPTLLGMMAVVFFIMKAAPGNVADILLSGEGEMQANEKRVRTAYLSRRYGLDKPVIVQFGRWLNKVSPIGFRTSSEVVADPKELARATEMLQSADHLLKHLNIQDLTSTAVAVSSYLNDDLIRVTQRMIQDTRDPMDTLGWLVRMDTLDEDDLSVTAAPPPPPAPVPDVNKPETLVPVIKPTTEQINQQFVAEVKWFGKHDPPLALKMAIQRLRDDSFGLDRILFTRPALKVPDLGESFTKRRPVVDMLAETIPITLLLNLLSLPLAYSLALATGVYAAKFRGKSFDMVSGVLLLALWSIPVIWAGVMLQGLLANKDGGVQWFPTSGLHSLNADQMAFLPSYDGDGNWQWGWLLDMGWHLVLPVICLSYGSVAFVSKLTRGAILENSMSDFVRTARAKGVSSNHVLWRHTFRNSLLPLITVAAFIIPSLLGGSVIVESIFSIEGMGKLAIESIMFKDQETVMAVTLISGILSVIAFLVADICYALADPRVAYE